VVSAEAAPIAASTANAAAEETDDVRRRAAREHDEREQEPGGANGHRAGLAGKGVCRSPGSGRHGGVARKVAGFGAFRDTTRCAGQRSMAGHDAAPLVPLALAAERGITARK